MHLWSVAIYDLRLDEETFYRLTPRQFHALQERNREEHIHAELLNGISTASIVNHSFCAPKKPYAPRLYMPSMQDSDAPENKSKNVPMSRQFGVLFGSLAPYRNIVSPDAKP